MKKWWNFFCFKAPLTQRCQSWVTFAFYHTSRQLHSTLEPHIFLGFDRNIVKLWDSWSCSGGGSSTRWTNHYDCRLLWFFLIIPDIWQQLTTDLHLSFFHNKNGFCAYSTPCVAEKFVLSRFNWVKTCTFWTKFSYVLLSHLFVSNVLSWSLCCHWVT